MVILILYVDDLLITGDDHLINQCKKDLITEFEMKDLRLLHYFLGLKVQQNSGSIILNQGKYTSNILKRFSMWNCKPMSSPMETNLHKLKEAAAESPSIDSTLYRQMIGSLMYLVNTKPNICYAVNALSQFMCEPKEIHLVVVKHIMRYLQDTLNFGLKYEKVALDLHGFTDLDWGGSVKDKKSTLGCCFSLGLAMISWICRKQSSVA